MSPLEIAQATIRASLLKFVICLKGLTLDDLQRKQADLMIQGWESFLEEPLLTKIMSKVENYNSLFGFSNELSPNLSFEDLLHRVSENFAEVDFVKQILGSYSNSEVKIQKNLGSKRLSICDFTFTVDGAVNLAEVKYIRTPKLDVIRKRTQYALGQIVASAKGKQYDGHVYFFTFQSPVGSSIEFQNQIESIHVANPQQFKYTLNVQIYTRSQARIAGLFGDGGFGIEL